MVDGVIGAVEVVVGSVGVSARVALSCQRASAGSAGWKQYTAETALGKPGFREPVVGGRKTKMEDLQPLTVH